MKLTDVQNTSMTVTQGTITDGSGLAVRWSCGGQHPLPFGGHPGTDRGTAYN